MAHSYFEAKPTTFSCTAGEGSKIGCGSFCEDSRGRWYINVPVEMAEAAQAANTRIGIDLGTKTLARLSSGGQIAMPGFHRAGEAKLATSQRARKSKRVKAIHAKIRNRRKDFLHKATTNLVRQYGFIAVGNVRPSKLAQTNMAKSVRDAGWSDLRTMLSWKSRLRGGGMCLEVSEHLTTQTCSECGCLPPSRPRGIAGLRIRDWICDDCGAVHDRDVNAARNILRIGLDALAEGAGAEDGGLEAAAFRRRSSRLLLMLEAKLAFSARIAYNIRVSRLNRGLRCGYGSRGLWSAPFCPQAVRLPPPSSRQRKFRRRSSMGPSSRQRRHPG
jgi:IS605 OrfB family transposase